MQKILGCDKQEWVCMALFAVVFVAVILPVATKIGYADFSFSRIVASFESSGSKEEKKEEGMIIVGKALVDFWKFENVSGKFWGSGRP